MYEDFQHEQPAELTVSELTSYSVAALL